MNQGPLRGSALYVRLEGMLEQGVRTFADLLIYGAVAPSTTSRYRFIYLKVAFAVIVLAKYSNYNTSTVIELYISFINNFF